MPVNGEAIVKFGRPFPFLLLRVKRNDMHAPARTPENRRHAALGMMSPVQYEQALAAGKAA